ncbi:hypothetical protein [Psychrobacter sp. AT9]|uniref:hypothetical protein n=1 Tax=Psychrobacter sp. AT9 TaxID=3242893 RepID=UPI0039A747C4
MELSSYKKSLEDSKYIYASDFIELISFSTRPNVKIERIAAYLIDENFDQQVTSYYSQNGKSYSKDLHRENFGFDLNTREYLRHCDSIKFSLCKYFLYSEEDDLNDDFLFSIDELESIECIQNLNIDFDRSVMFQVGEASRKYNNEINPYIFRIADDGLDLENPEHNKIHELNINEFARDKLAVLDTYSVMYAACLLSGDSPTEIRKFQSHLEFTQVFSEYISYKLMIELAIKDGDLHICEDKILAADLKDYLGQNGYFFRGFNDWMAIEPAKPLINNKSSKQIEASNDKLKEAQEKVAYLESQLEQTKAELEDNSVGDEPTHHKSVGSMQALVTTLIKMAEYDKADLADPYGEFNKLIQAKSEVLGLSVKKDFIAKWLKKANEVL